MLKRALDGLRVETNQNVLVGYETADDAAVYRLDEENAIVQTIDFFTPIVDDPYLYGQIAAANALSDVYAMGGTPIFALSVVGFPGDELDESVLREVFQGGADKMREAGVPILGGHSVKDREMKFGYTVTGLVSPRRLFKNFGARVGDALVLTKPIGTGIISTSIKFGQCASSTAESAIAWMIRLNRLAAEALQGRTVHAVTDITGYGLVGHAYEMASASKVCLKLAWKQVPLLDGLLVEAGKGMFAGGIEANRRFVGEAVCWGGLEDLEQKILLDPQTSGGLLIALPEQEAVEFVEQLRSRGEFAVRIGSVVAVEGRRCIEVVYE